LEELLRDDDAPSGHHLQYLTAPFNLILEFECNPSANGTPMKGVVRHGWSPSSKNVHCA
jgi:hypothetical protein